MTPELKLGLEILGGGVLVVSFLGGVYKLQKPFVKEDKCTEKRKQCAVKHEGVDKKFEEVDDRLDKGSDEFKGLHADIAEIKTDVAVVKNQTSNTQDMVKGLCVKLDNYQVEVKKMNGNGCKCKEEEH